MIPRRMRTEKELDVQVQCHILVDLLPKSCSSPPVLLANSADEIGRLASAIMSNNFRSIGTRAHIYVEGWVCFTQYWSIGSLEIHTKNTRRLTTSFGASNASVNWRIEASRVSRACLSLLTISFTLFWTCNDTFFSRVSSTDGSVTDPMFTKSRGGLN